MDSDGKKDQYLEALTSVHSGLKEIQNSVNQLDKKMDLHIQKTDYRFDNIEKLDEAQNELLAQHAQRSEEIKKDNELRESQLRHEIMGDHPTSLKTRVEQLEIPRKWLATTKTAILWLSALFGAIVAIKEAIGHLF